MDKKAIRCLALSLTVSVLIHTTAAASGFSGIATPDTADRQKGNVKETDFEQTIARGDIFQVTMPADVEHVFDFIMDPQELIKKTDAAAYSGSHFEEDATLFFRRTDGGEEVNYSSSSDVLTITNNGEADVLVTLTARISPDSISGITMSDDPEFPDNTEASLYLALTDGEMTEPVSSEDGAVMQVVIPGVFPGEEPNEYWFQLTGAVNREGDWSQVVDVAPKITVTWMVSMDEEDISAQEELWDDTGAVDAGKHAKQEESSSAEGPGGGEESTAAAESSPAGSKPNKESSAAAGQETSGESKADEGNQPVKNEESSASGESVGDGGGNTSGESPGESVSSGADGNTGEKENDGSTGNGGENMNGSSGEYEKESGDSGEGAGMGGNSGAGEGAETDKGGGAGGSAEADKDGGAGENAGTDKGNGVEESAGADKSGGAGNSARVDKENGARENAGVNKNNSSREGTGINTDNFVKKDTGNGENIVSEKAAGTGGL